MKALLRSRSSRERIELQKQAVVWLESDGGNVALAQMRQAAINTWLRADTTAGREECWYEVQRIDSFVRRLNAIMADGKKARQE